jgi:hypothetical protein
MARKHKASGGEADFGKSRYDEDPAPNTVYAGKGSNVVTAADEKKKGGRAKRKRGGAASAKIAKHVGQVKGEQHFPNAGRAPRKSGGRTGSNFSPLSSAHAGTPPRGHKVTEID